MVLLDVCPETLVPDPITALAGDEAEAVLLEVRERVVHRDELEMATCVLATPAVAAVAR